MNEMYYFEFYLGATAVFQFENGFYNGQNTFPSWNILYKGNKNSLICLTLQDKKSALSIGIKLVSLNAKHLFNTPLPSLFSSSLFPPFPCTSSSMQQDLHHIPLYLFCEPNKIKKCR